MVSWVEIIVLGTNLQKWNTLVYTVQPLCQPGSEKAAENDVASWPKVETRVARHHHQLNTGYKTQLAYYWTSNKSEEKTCSTLVGEG